MLPGKERDQQQMHGRSPLSKSRRIQDNPDSDSIPTPAQRLSVPTDSDDLQHGNTSHMTQPMTSGSTTLVAEIPASLGFPSSEVIEQQTSEVELSEQTSDKLGQRKNAAEKLSDGGHLAPSTSQRNQEAANQLIDCAPVNIYTNLPDDVKEIVADILEAAKSDEIFIGYHFMNLESRKQLVEEVNDLEATNQFRNAQAVTYSNNKAQRISSNRKIACVHTSSMTKYKTLHRLTRHLEYIVQWCTLTLYGPQKICRTKV